MIAVPHGDLCRILEPDDCLSYLNKPRTGEANVFDPLTAEKLGGCKGGFVPPVSSCGQARSVNPSEPPKRGVTVWGVPISYPPLVLRCAIRSFIWLGRRRVESRAWLGE